MSDSDESADELNSDNLIHDLEQKFIQASKSVATYDAREQAQLVKKLMADTIATLS